MNDIIARPSRPREAMELPCGGMPSTSDDEDGNVGKFYAPACPGHRGNFGGWKHPPPTVTPMKHAGPLTRTERKSYCHHTVRQGGLVEEATVSGGEI